MSTLAPPQRQFLTVREVATLLRLDEKTVRRRIRAGVIPALRTGGPRSALRVDARELEQWLYADDVDAGAARRLHPVSATASAVPADGPSPHPGGFDNNDNEEILR
jgi:excisionase family DNA binding protein